MVRRRAASVSMAACAAGVLVLGACDSGGSPTSSTSSSTSSSPSPSTSSSTSAPASSTSSSPAYVPVKPEFPAEAKKQTVEGSLAYVRYFYDVVNYAYTKPDSKVIASLGTTTCAPCSRLQARTVELVKARERYKSALVAISGVESVSTSLTNPLVIATGKQFEVSIVNSEGIEAEGSHASKVNFRVSLVWEAGGWKVDGVENT